MQTEDSIYSLKNVALYEALYGKNLISLGGTDAIDNMFSDIDLSRLKALDVGFGLGGVVFHLAKKYHIEIAGIEIDDWMAKYAQAQAPDEVAHLLTFSIYNEAGKIPFETGSFDLVYSKGVLNHVRDKESLFREINRVLKPDGLFVIADWIHPEATKDDSSPLVKETQETYNQVLSSTGFTNINFRDDSKVFLIYVKKLLENITKQRKFIEEEFGTEMFSTIFDDHQQLIDDIKQHHKFAIRIKAKKR